MRKLSAKYLCQSFRTVGQQHIFEGVARVRLHVGHEPSHLALVLCASKPSLPLLHFVKRKGWSFVILLKRPHLLLKCTVCIAYNVLALIAGVRLHTILAYLCLMSSVVVIDLFQQFVGGLFANVVNDFLWLHRIIHYSATVNILGVQVSSFWIVRHF